MDTRDRVRQQVTRVLDEHSAAILHDAIGLLPFAGLESANADTCIRLGEIVLQILIASIRDEDVDPRCAQVTALRRLAREKGLAVPQLFGLIYIVERAALDELALDESFGATSEPWPTIAQLVRRASVAAMAGFAERLSLEAGEGALRDPLTTLHSGAMLMAAMEKEIERAERSQQPFALILFDLDRFSHINAKRGFDFGDRVLERVGIVLRNYFREQDWVCRVSADKFAVLLPETSGEHAEALAERVRVTVQDRMALRDYKSDEQVAVTVSVGVVAVDGIDAKLRGKHLLQEAELATQRAKETGRNRVVRIGLDFNALAS